MANSLSASNSLYVQLSNPIMFSLPFFIIFFLFTIFYPSANSQFTECSQPYDCNVQAMTIARPDLWDSPCTNNFINVTLDYDLFAYNAQTIRNMTIFYGCMPHSESVPNNFT
ncbi:hypothetical protein DVH24_009078 [Malus domestica]|uniref:Wall-associated receptor kinase galacturonan-binding domain-containing protein n=1 Tax=Malus domestica TaxID=3750 RepID=A0A498JRW3_MALDO|nr:hypothetical protein DVH24_009078 [Malus domestica]